MEKFIYSGLKRLIYVVLLLHGDYFVADYVGRIGSRVGGIFFSDIDFCEDNMMRIHRKSIPPIFLLIVIISKQRASTY